MRTSVLERRQRVPVSLDEAFAHAGALMLYRLRVKGVAVRWLTEITAWHPPRSFTDVQRAGPYRLWEHTHRLAPVEDGTEIYDHVRYRVPGGPLARLVDRFVRPLLDEIAATEQQIAKMKDDIKKYGAGGFDVTTGMKNNVAYIEDWNGQVKELEKRKADLEKKLDQLAEQGRKAGAEPAWFR